MQKLLIFIVGLILCILFPPLIVVVFLGFLIYIWAEGIGGLLISKAEKRRSRKSEKGRSKKKYTLDLSKM